MVLEWQAIQLLRETAWLMLTSPKRVLLVSRGILRDGLKIADHLVITLRGETAWSLLHTLKSVDLYLGDGHEMSDFIVTLEGGEMYCIYV